MINAKFILLGLLLAPAMTLAAGLNTFTVGSLQVSRYGNHGRPLILIPGTGSGAWVWQATIAHFQSRHVIYVVTLAGFDGTPAPSGDNYIDQADASLLELIEARHIRKPVLIGHSLGGGLAIRFAEEHSKLLAGVIAVEAPPVFPGIGNLAAAERQKMARELRADYAAMTPAKFTQQQQQEMREGGVLDAGLADRLGVMQARSDPAAVGQYVAEGVLTDLRAGLGNIRVPLLEISAYNPPDFARGPTQMTQAQKTESYSMLLQGAPDARVISISPARHFLMFDQPDKFHAAVTEFLASLPQD